MGKNNQAALSSPLFVHPIGVGHGLEDAEIGVEFKLWHKLMLYVYVCFHARVHL